MWSRRGNCNEAAVSTLDERESILDKARGVPTPRCDSQRRRGVGGSSSRWRAMIMGIEKQKELDSFFKFKLMAA